MKVSAWYCVEEWRRTGQGQLTPWRQSVDKAARDLMIIPFNREVVLLFRLGPIGPIVEATFEEAERLFEKHRKLNGEGENA